MVAFAMRQVLLYPDHEDGGWIAEVPSLPGCLSQGDTREDAMTNIRDAVAVWIDGAKQVGLPVPVDSLEVQVCILTES